jgi:uncharacterized membrane protein YccC
VLGAATWAIFGLLRGAGLPVVVPLACVALFCMSLARVWGAAAAAVGTILSIVLILSLDRPLQPVEAAEIAGMFVLGGLWATLLTLVVWRLHPYRPARVAVAGVWRRMAGLAGDLHGLVRRGDVGVPEWEAHARAHRRAVREEIEYARTLVMDLVGMRARFSLRGAQALLRLEAGDQVFGALIALSDLLESDLTPARRQAAEAALRLLRPMLVVLSRAMLTDAPMEPTRLERGLTAALAATQDDPVLHGIAGTVADRLRIAARLSAPDGYRPEGAAGGVPQPWRDRVLGPVRANLSWNSAMLRHALRVAIIAAPALVATLLWEGQFAHWLTITVVVTLQPFYAATWQRALERVGGTMLGGLVGAALALLAHTPLLLAVMLFPLCAFAFAARQVSFTAWIAGITPVVIVLMELVHPGHSSWEIAGMRALFTLAGGVIAVVGWLLLWPSWEPDRLRRELQSALAAHADYARAVLSGLAGEADAPGTEATRRLAGMSTNNLEASLARALQEPGHEQRHQVEAVMVVDASLRRIAGRLSALAYDTDGRAALTPAEWRRWSEWVTAALTSMAENRSPALARPDAGTETLARIARQIELLTPPLARLLPGKAGATP